MKKIISYYTQFLLVFTSKVEKENGGAREKCSGTPVKRGHGIFDLEL